MLSWPPELYLLAFDHLPLSSLANITICSHQFRIWAFSLLYRKVILKNDEQMLEFASRVAEEQGPSRTRKIIDNLHAAEYVKCLCIGPDEGYYTTDALDLLASAIPYLTELTNLVWVASSFEDSQIASTFMLIREHCIEFDSLSIRLDWGGEEQDEHMNSVLGFTGLRHLRLSAYDMYTINNELPSAMVNMVRSSPDLSTLDLCVIDSYDFPRRTWNADAFFESIAETQYPHLRCLRLRGAAGIDLHRLSDISAIPSPFHSFIVLNHRNIVTLAMPNPINDSERGLDDLRLPKDIFPSLREFEGTISWCFYISGLQYPASCLSKMKILMQRELDDDEEEHGFERIYSALKSCLVLTELDLLRDVFWLGYVVTADRITELSKYAPGLHSLGCFIDVNETLDSVSSALGKFRALRSLAFNLFNFEDATDNVLFTLAKRCPALTSVKGCTDWSKPYGMFDEYV
ncbi:hypothetical protein FPV67DRAFT_1781101 [Lyophyllum atratum]|nr:hypothetical protein FPV67DRAFT_1781101 [Lyophyllum atratum]